VIEIPSLWIPPDRIRPIALGILIHDGRLLVMRVVDAAGALVGLRPPGGGVEFGETAEAALHREFREEFDCAVEITGLPLIFENLYEFNGRPGHEIVFAFPIASPAILARVVDHHVVSEENGSRAVAEWVAVGSLIGGEPRLFPPGLLATLTPRR